MKRKIMHFVAFVIEIILLAGACAVYYFADTRMGMARYVLYLNEKWKKALPLELLIPGAMIVLGALALLILFLSLRKASSGKITRTLMAWINILLTAAVIFLAVSFSPKDFRSYYQVLLLLSIFSLILNIHTGAVVLSRSDRPRSSLEGDGHEVQ